MEINCMSAPDSNRFSPKHLKSALQDITHSGLLLAGHASTINHQPLIVVNTSAPRLTQSTRDCQSGIKKQAQFYHSQVMAQFARTLAESEQAACEQITFSENIQSIGINESNLTIRQIMADAVNQLSAEFNHYYVTARELAEASVIMSQSSKADASRLSRHLDQHSRQLPDSRESALAIMTAIDLLEDTLGQTQDEWVADAIARGTGIQDFIIRQEAITGSTCQHHLHLKIPTGNDQQNRQIVINRHAGQRSQLYQELSKISNVLVTVKTIESQLRLYSNYMNRLYAAAKRLATNWGKISNDFAIQAHQLGAQSDSNQLFKMLASDIPVSTYYWQLLADTIDALKRSFSERQTMFPVMPVKAA